jgi:hypothetical protein
MPRLKVVPLDGKCIITLQHSVANLKSMLTSILPLSLHDSIHHLEQIKKIKKLFIVIPSNQLSAIFELLHGIDPFDDQVLYEIEECSGIAFNWSEAKLIKLISQHGLEQAVQMLKNESIDRCYQTGLFIEKLCRSDATNESLENMFIQIECFSQLPESHPKFKEANEKIYTICNSIHYSCHSKSTQLWLRIELLRSMYKLVKFDEAVSLLTEICAFKDTKSINPITDLSSMSLINHIIDMVREFHDIKQFPSPLASSRLGNSIFSEPSNSSAKASSSTNSV